MFYKNVNIAKYKLQYVLIDIIKISICYDYMFKINYNRKF